MADEGIYSLLAKAQAAMVSPKKNGVGQIGTRKYAYATLDDVLDAIKPPLNENGLFLTQRTVNGENCLFIQTIVGHGSETLLLDEEPYEYDPNPQEYGKRETYAKRYGLCKAFAIVGDEDHGRRRAADRSARPALEDHRNGQGRSDSQGATRQEEVAHALLAAQGPVHGSGREGKRS